MSVSNSPSTNSDESKAFDYSTPNPTIALTLAQTIEPFNRQDKVNRKRTIDSSASDSSDSKATKKPKSQENTNRLFADMPIRPEDIDFTFFTMLCDIVRDFKNKINSAIRFQKKHNSDNAYLLTLTKRGLLETEKKYNLSKKYSNFEETNKLFGFVKIMVEVCKTNDLFEYTNLEKDKTTIQEYYDSLMFNS